MNKVERGVYDLVKNHPRLKLKIRNIYQQVFDLLPRPPLQTAYHITAREGYFFGFHDHTPFSVDGSMLLSNRYAIPLRMPRPDDQLEVGFFTGVEHSRFVPLATTRAWNWHMGCKLQWRGEMPEVVFNDHRGGRDVARIVDVCATKDIVLPEAVGSVSGDGRWAVGYSFARVEHCMPGYGYQHRVEDPECSVGAPAGHGIHVINLETCATRTIFSIADISAIEPTPTMKGARHFFSHTVFSPNSERFIFLHRWIHDDVNKRWSRMISSDLDGRKVHIFPTIGMVSHIGWRGPDQVVAYCRIAGSGDRYVLFRDCHQSEFEIIGGGDFNSDGHPSFENSGRWMVTDTYPDRRRRQSLILYDTRHQRRYDLARLPSSHRYQTPSPEKHWACDLHPRWSRDGSVICFDSVHTGTRALCTIQVGPDLASGRPLSL